MGNGNWEERDLCLLNGNENMDMVEEKNFIVDKRERKQSEASGGIQRRERKKEAEDGWQTEGQERKTREREEGRGQVNLERRHRPRGQEQKIKGPRGQKDRFI